jgi:hypothetical protein
MYRVSDARTAVRVESPSFAPAQAKLPFDPQLIDLKKIADARQLFELEQLEVSLGRPDRHALDVHAATRAAKL